MDAAGARALARRIEEQRQREAARDPVVPPPTEVAPPVRLSFTPPELPPAAPRRERQARERQVEIAPAGRGAEAKRDIRMYSRTVEREIIDGQPAFVTTVHCLALVDGEWHSRVVDVQVERASD
jgi:hypothetical protein